MNHSLLLKKFKNFGFGGQVLSWFSSYLKSKTQCVIWKNRISKELIVKNGVPQGFVLGSVFFILYFNDFVDACKLFTPYFLPTTPASFSKKPSLEELNTEILSVSHWVHQNKLDLNESKTFVIVFFWNQGKHKLSKLRISKVQCLQISRSNSRRYFKILSTCGIHFFKIKAVGRNNCKAKENLRSQHHNDVLQNYGGTYFWVWNSYLWLNNNKLAAKTWTVKKKFFWELSLERNQVTPSLKPFSSSKF